MNNIILKVYSLSSLVLYDNYTNLMNEDGTATAEIYNDLYDKSMYTMGSIYNIVFKVSVWTGALSLIFFAVTFCYNGNRADRRKADFYNIIRVISAFFLLVSVLSIISVICNTGLDYSNITL